MFEKKKIFVFSAARFIISEWLMTRNYPDIITYVFCKKRVITEWHVLRCSSRSHDHCKTNKIKRPCRGSHFDA
jgi:membrane-bound acyltransferase YfiQ involved in biofilm formation